MRVRVRVDVNMHTDTHVVYDLSIKQKIFMCPVRQFSLPVSGPMY